MCVNITHTALSVGLSHINCGAVYISLQCFFCHNLQSLFDGQPVDHHLQSIMSQSSYIHAVLSLPGKRFPSNYPSVTTITTSLRLFQCPHLANFRFSVAKVAHSHPVLQYSAAPNHWSSIQSSRSTSLQNHNVAAVISFSSHFITAQLSDPYNAMLHTNALTSCFFRFRPVSAGFQLSVSCLMICRAVTNRTFISVELLSLVTIDPKKSNLSTRPIQHTLHKIQ